MPHTRDAESGDETNFHHSAPEKPQRDWLALLAPTLLAVIAGLAIQLVGYIWLTATTQARVTNVELRVKVTEDAIRNLPIDYVPRAEHIRNDAMLKEERDQEEQRLNRMDQKLDTLLERGR